MMQQLKAQKLLEEAAVISASVEWVKKEIEKNLELADQVEDPLELKKIHYKLNYLIAKGEVEQKLMQNWIKRRKKIKQ